MTALSKQSLLHNFRKLVKGGPAKYVLSENIILLATHFPEGKHREGLPWREWGNLPNPSR